MLVLPGQAKKQQQQKSRDLKRSGEKSQQISFEDKMLFSPKCCWYKYDSDLTGAIIVKSISRISRPTNLRRIFVICLHNISLSVTHYVTCSQKLHFESKCSTILTDIWSWLLVHQVTLLLISYSSLLNCIQSVVSWTRQTSAWSTSSDVSIIE